MVEDTFEQSSPIGDSSFISSQFDRWQLHGEVEKLRIDKIGIFETKTNTTNNTIIGTLYLTSYRLRFVTPNLSKNFSIPLNSLCHILESYPGGNNEEEVGRICFRSKDLQMVTFIILKKTVMVANVKCTDGSIIRNIKWQLEEYLSNTNIGRLFCFSYREYLEMRVKMEHEESHQNSLIRSGNVRSDDSRFIDPFYRFSHIGYSEEEIKLGHQFYNSYKEFNRQNIHVFHNVTESAQFNSWRSVNNEKYERIRTYPPTIYVPSHINDEVLNRVLEYRSQGRLPALTWRYIYRGLDEEENPCPVMLRSSQPLVGLGRKISPDDVYFINSVRKISNSEFFYFVDLRSRKNTWGNTIIGKGTELVGSYERAKHEFHGIENIHVMSSSFEYLQKAINEKGQDGTWLSSLENSGWLTHTKCILDSAVRVVEIMHVEQCSCLVHCSDGWDRTSQVCALAQMMMDPFFRTIDGFIVLIEKDWISFGHQFRERSGWGENQMKNAPIFLQFLDCVWYLRSQDIEHYEFNEDFLITLVHHVYSGLFSTFSFNSMKERREYKEHEQTVSLWSFIRRNRMNYKSLFYTPSQHSDDPETCIIVPKLVEIKTISSVFWKGLYFNSHREEKSTQKKTEILMSELLREKENEMGRIIMKLRKEVEKRKRAERRALLLEKKIKELKGDEYTMYFPARNNSKMIKNYWFKIQPVKVFE